MRADDTEPSGRPFRTAALSQSCDDQAAGEERVTFRMSLSTIFERLKPDLRVNDKIDAGIFDKLDHVFKFVFKIVWGEITLEFKKHR